VSKPAGTVYTPGFHVEFAFGYAAFADTTDGSWTEPASAFPNDVIIDDVKIERGRPTEFDDFPPASANIIIKDRARKLDPSNSAGPYYANLKPGTPVRVRAVSSATNYVRFTGYVDGWPVQSGRGQSIVKLKCWDAFEIFANTKLPNVYDYTVLASSPQAYWRLGESTGTRAVDASPNRCDGEYIGPSTGRGLASVVPYGGDGSMETHGNNYEGVVITDESAKVGSSTTGSMCIELWIADNGEVGNGREDLVRQGTGGSYGIGWTLNVFPETYNDLLATDSWLYQQHSDVIVLALISTPAVYYWPAKGIATDQLPHHIVVNVDVAGGVVTGPGTGGVATCYLDGAQLTLGTTDAGPLANTASEIYIGAGALTVENASFAGRVDNVALYRASLSASTIANHYAVGTNPWDKETTGVRIGRILDLIGWSATARDIDVGEMLCGPAVLDGQTALEYMQTIARSEQGRLFMSHDGKVTFHQRDRFLTQSTETTSQYNFSDDGAGNAVVEAPSFQKDRRFIYNRAAVTRDGGVEQLIDNTSSQSTYGVRTKTLSGLALRDDRNARAIADYIVYRYNTPQVRSDEWSLQPEIDAASWAALFALRIGYRVTLEQKPANVGAQIALDMHIETIIEQITPETWRMTFSGSPVDPNSAAYFTWGGVDATQGWGVGLWR
jgi:hypothetical protein